MAETAVKTSDAGQRLSVVEKVGYGLGDTAANFIFQTMVMFQLAFYTDTFGITAAAAGTLLVVVRVWDAIFDPIMGVVADRTNTRWGKFRPWVLWTAVPFGIMGFLAFMTPDLSPGGKLVYAYLTYIVLMMVYSANNLPYSALSGVMTGDLGERTSLSSYRFVCAMIAQLVIQGLALPMVHHFGQGNNAKGYQVHDRHLLGARRRALLHHVRDDEGADPAAAWTEGADQAALRGPAEERSLARDVRPDAGAVHHALDARQRRARTTSTTSSTRRAWRHCSAASAASATDEGAVVSLGFSVFNVLGTLATIVAIFFSKSLATRYGKRNVFIAGLAGTIVFTAIFAVLPATAVAAMFVSEILRQFAYGFTIPLLWAMMADVADFSEWKTGRRATAIVFSAIVFALKAGLGFGGAITGFVLSLYGYVPNVGAGSHRARRHPSDDERLPGDHVRDLRGVPFFYAIDKRTEIQMTNELAERRRGYAS